MDSKIKSVIHNSPSSSIYEVVNVQGDGARGAITVP